MPAAVNERVTEDGGASRGSGVDERSCGDALGTRGATARPRARSLVRRSLLRRMPRSIAQLPMLLSLLGLALLAGGCSGDDGNPAAARREIVVDFNVGDGRLATDVPIVAWQLALDPAGNVLLADWHGVRRIDRRTGTIATVPGTTVTVCADGSPASAGGCSTAVVAVAADRAGRVYFALGDQRVMRVDRGGGAPEHVAGKPREQCPDPRPVAGPAHDVCFADVRDLAVDPTGRVLVADATGGRVLRLDPATSIVAAVAGNGAQSSECPDDVLATETCIGFPLGIDVDRAGGIGIGSYDQPVRRVDPETGLIGRVALQTRLCAEGEEPPEGGPALDACHRATSDVAVDGEGVVYFADDFDFRYFTAPRYRIRRVEPSGIMTTFDAPPFDFGVVDSLAVDDDGRLFALGYVDPSAARQVRRFGAGPGSGTVIAGNGTASFCGDGGPARDACLGFPNAVAVGPDDSIYVADGTSLRIRRIVDGVITTVAGNGTTSFGLAPRCAEGVPATETCAANPDALAVDRDGVLYFTESIPGPPDEDDRTRVRRVDARGIVRTVVGGCPVEADATSVPAVDACLDIIDIATASDGTLYVAASYGIFRLDAAAGRLVPHVMPSPDCPPYGGGYDRPECFAVYDFTFDRAGTLYMTDGTRVRRVAAGTSTPEIIAGNGTDAYCGDGGPAIEACTFAVRVVADGAGNVFIADVGTVRRVDAETGIITTVAGMVGAPCLYNGAGTIRPDLGCATVHAIDGRGRLVYPEVRDYYASRIVRLEIPVGRPVP